MRAYDINIRNDGLGVSGAITNFAVLGGNDFSITSGGVLTFTNLPDFETKSVYTVTVQATDASANNSTQEITVIINDVGGGDDNTATGTGTATSTGTGTSTSTSTSTSTGTGT